MEHDFVVSALKYRPDTFDSVVGQSAITNTLKNAIRNEHLGKAFLFCGPRGVGKTTCARILAKVINCERPTEALDPCGECAPCKDFQEGHSLNIHELDAASNNKVEHIRELIEQVRLAPQVGSYKVYIIDEVHMLSQQAFNAFLKTLEEPPEHAIFILATTEKHKVLPTILSRCQIYDFHRIGIPDITEHLQGIAEREGIAAEREALHTIAIKAEGALRDALSIFDQLVASSGKELSYQHVVQSLNILDHEHFFKLTDQLLQGDVAQSILSFDDILRRGFDGQHFLNGLAQHFRDLLMARDERTLSLLEVSEELQQRFGEQAKSCDPDLLVDALNSISEADSQYKGSKDQRLLVELTLMKLCRMMGGQEALKKKVADESPSEEASSAKDNPEGEKKRESKGQASPSNESSNEEREEPPPEEDKPPQEQKVVAERNGTEPPPDETLSEEGDGEPGASPRNGAAETPASELEGAEPSTSALEEAGRDEPIQEKEKEAAVHEGTEGELASEEPSHGQEAHGSEAEVEEGAPETIEVAEDAASKGNSTQGTEQEKIRSKAFKGTTPRISDFGKSPSQGEEEEEVEEPVQEKKSREPFGGEALRKSWDRYLKELQVEGAKQALKKGPPRIGGSEQEELELVLESRMEEKWVEHVKEGLLQHLRKELQNHYVDLKTSVKKSDGEEERTPYTAKQHFDRMQEKNPKLKELRDRFDLDLDR